MLDQFKKIVVAALLVGSSFSICAQDVKVENKDEKHIKIEVIDKDGKKHVIDEKFTGEMPESLKKKIADLKAKMKAEGKDLNLDFNWNEKGGNKFIIKEFKDGEMPFGEGVTNGKVKVVMIDAEGGKDVWVESFDGEEMPESLKQKIEKLKSECEKDGKKMTIDISLDSEAGEGVFGLREGDIKKDGHIVIIKDGNTVLEEKFEGEMSDELKKKLELHKANGADIEIDEIKQIDVKKLDGKEGKHKIVIVTTDGEEIKEGEGGSFTFKVDEDIDVDGEGSVKIFVFRNVVIEDISEDDKDIPENLRQPAKATFGESLTDLNFYPNPNNGTFNLKFNLQEKGATDIAIYNLNGQEIYREQLGDFSGLYNGKIDLQGQSKGVYILKVSQGDKVLTKKVVVE